MNYIKISGNAWSINAQTGQIGPAEDPAHAVDLTFEDEIQNQNINLLLARKSTRSLYITEKGELKHGISFQTTQKVNQAASLVFKKLLEKVEQLEGGQKAVAEHFFYHFMRDTKIKYSEKKECIEVLQTYDKKGVKLDQPITKQHVWWEEKRIFSKDGLMNHLDIIIGDLFWSVNSETGLISKPLPLKERNIENLSHDLTESSTAEVVHNLQMLFLRKKGNHFFADKDGFLRKGMSGDSEKTGCAVNKALARMLWKVDQLNAKAAVLPSPETPPFLEQAKELATVAKKIVGQIIRSSQDDDFLTRLQDAASALENASLEEIPAAAMRLSDGMDHLLERVEGKEDFEAQVLRLSADTARLSLNTRKALDGEEVEIGASEVEEAKKKRAPLSHFLYQFMNREGTIGRLNSKIGYVGERDSRLFNQDLMEEHVDIVIGKHYWSVNTVTGHISKALPIKERHQAVTEVKLSGDAEVNDTLKKLFERKGSAYFHEKEGRLERVSKLKDRFSYCLKKTKERARVQVVVARAIKHLDQAVVGQDNPHLSRFLQGKLQGVGPLARMKTEHFDRSAISEGGGIEGHLKHELQDARDDLAAKLKLLNKHPLKKFETPEIPKEHRLLVEEITLAVIKDKVYEKVQDDVKAALEHQIQQGNLREEMRANLTKMTEFMARRVVRASAYQTRDKERVVVELRKKAELTLEAIAQVNYTRQQIIRHQVKEALHELLIQEFLFAQSLGINLKAVGDGGSGGARYAFDRRGRKILVVKPDDEGPYGRNNPRWTAYIKQLFLKIRSCLADNSEPVTEVSSYNIDKAFDLDIVPSTSVRRLRSARFVGKEKKWCSVQAYVNDCKPMQNALGFEKGWDKYVWMFNQAFTKREKIAERFAPEGVFAQNLAEVIEEKGEAFQKSFARFIIHNFLIGDTDCHFDNWFVKTKKVTDPVLLALFSEREVEESQIENLVQRGLFTGELYYQLHDALFHAEENFIIVKHDGGSSMPRRHPLSNFEVRLAYLFEVLPQMREVFSEEVKSMFKDSDRSAFEAIAEVAIQNLVNSSTASDFCKFWNEKENRVLFKKWLFTRDPQLEKTMRTTLSEFLSLAHEQHRAGWWHWHYNGHLNRIKGIADSFMDRWQSLIAHLQEKPAEEPRIKKEASAAVRNKEMKTLFGIKQFSDFDKFRDGHSTNRAYTSRMEILQASLDRWTKSEFLETTYEVDHQQLMQMSKQLLRDLG